MTKKLWQVEGVKNHLLAVRTGIRARMPAALQQTEAHHRAAYQEGCEAVIRCLVDRFGINLDGPPAAGQTQTGELRLKTWTREDIGHDLQVVWLIMCDETLLSNGLETRMEAYYQGIRSTLRFVAISFGIEDLSLPVCDSLALS